MDKRARDVIEMILDEARIGGYIEFELDDDDIAALEQLLEEDERDEEVSDVQVLED